MHDNTPDKPVWAVSDEWVYLAILCNQQPDLKQFSRIRKYQMHIITQKRINDAKHLYPESASSLDAWYKTMKAEQFRDFSHLRSQFGSVDKVGNLFVFDIGGNKLRLIAAIHFNSGKVFIRHILTHSEYDKNHWKK